METTAPSGRQLELVHGESRAVVTEVGGGLRDYRVGAVTVLDGYGPGEMAGRGRGQLLLPWPNRVAAGRYTFRGTSHQLPVNEVALGNASHGLTRWLGWELERLDAGAARAQVVLRAQSGYPFTVAFSALYRLDGDGLTVSLTATNLGDTAAPVGMGAHPYFVLAGADGSPAPADDMTVTVPAATRLLTDERLIPVGAEEVTGGPFDLRDPRPLGGLVLDTCFTGLERAADGRARVTLTAAGGSLTIWQDAAWPFVQLFTGDTFTPGERRRSIAVEPMTCPANAFNSGNGLRVLEPGESFGGSWGVCPKLR
ncbi:MULTISPECIES: aldose 1-epimerase family protein [unclassified Parafrankia]|uniref:aldose 1-epimerase family protein n=1 Tax=unclassified Parafrankia TaxID=2994368 RepID=UPI000DA4702F|nr:MULTISPECIES: aldose 1-epimerase family protein [unclassified Parafrankia]TCJ32965.1 aldose epimerase [Parafrankia sp. BMG5.11]SQD94433.1 Aldose 1-epimerase [Parafrankia sp. Ea1.12]